MQPWICATCGVEYPTTLEPPAHCPICEDERQYLGPKGQQWTTMAELAREHAVEWRELEAGLSGVGVKPSFCIGQRAIFIEPPSGGILYDCVSLVDGVAAEQVARRGGLWAIVPSHPHFYGAMASWSERFGDVPIWVHEADREWVVRVTPAVRFRSSDTLALADGVTLVHIGGHFDGATVLHWTARDGRGVILAGDTIDVAQDTRWMSFMRSIRTTSRWPRTWCAASSVRSSRSRSTGSTARSGRRIVKGEAKAALARARPTAICDPSRRKCSRGSGG